MLLGQTQLMNCVLKEACATIVFGACVVVEYLCAACTARSHTLFLRRSENCFRNMLRLLYAFTLLCLQCGAVEAHRAENPAFMLVGGLSAPSEMCVSAENGSFPVMHMFYCLPSL